METRQVEFACHRGRGLRPDGGGGDGTGQGPPLCWRQSSAPEKNCWQPETAAATGQQRGVPRALPTAMLPALPVCWSASRRKAGAVLAAETACCCRELGGGAGCIPTACRQPPCSGACCGRVQRAGGEILCDFPVEEIRREKGFLALSGPAGKVRGAAR